MVNATVQSHEHGAASVSPLATIMVLLVVGWISFAIHRLYFDKLSKFPGDKLAALTSWYNAYYDLVAGGQYVWKVQEMHRKYGPIIRTRPDLIHVNDPNFIDKLYSQSPKQRRERYWTVVQPLHAPGSILATVDHDMHRKRRTVLNPFFSKQNVRRLEPIINDTLAALLRRMQGWAVEGKPIRIISGFRAATKDIIQTYAFGEGEKYLDMEDCNAAFFDLMEGSRMGHLGTHVNWLAATMADLPPAVMIAIIPRVAVFARYMMGLNARIDEIRLEKQDASGRKTIFHEILQSDMPEEEKETKRLADEAMVIVIAGSETTASILTSVVYRLLAHPEFLARLKAELLTVMPNPDSVPSAAELDGLPFLNAFINEVLRLHPSAVHRQDRLAPDEDLTYEAPDGTNYVIPAGTAVSMTAPLVNRSSMVYDRPDEFLPDRYLDDPRLLRYLLSFSKGTRQCIGINLAYQELQTFTAGIFRKYSLYDPSKVDQGGPTLELYQTTIDDIQMHADYITPAPVVGSVGLQLIMRN